MISHLLPLFIFYRNGAEKFIKYQANSSCVIISLILMTTLFYKALILQGEIWCWSFLGLKGLRAPIAEWESNGQIAIRLYIFKKKIRLPDYRNLGEMRENSKEYYVKIMVSKRNSGKKNRILSRWWHFFVCFINNGFLHFVCFSLLISCLHYLSFDVISPWHPCMKLQQREFLVSHSCQFRFCKCHQ